MLTPLAFAYLGAAVYDEVDLLFVSWSAKLLTEKGLKEAKVCADHAGTDDAIKTGGSCRWIARRSVSIIKHMKETGKTNFYLCSLAGQVFGVTKEAAIPELN